MSTFRFQGLANVLAAAALVATLTGLATAPALAQSHGHDANPHAKLSLNHGRKWVTDAPLRDGMDRIRALVVSQLAAAQAGTLSQSQYTTLASQVENEVAGIVAHCKLQPAADAVLHVVIGEIGAGTEAMAGKAATPHPAQGLEQVARALNDYARYFNHPGFKPIRHIQ